MIKTSELKSREVINIQSGKKLGLIQDIEIDMDSGLVKAVSIPYGNRLMGIFSKNEELVIAWDKIRKIGEDVILVAGESEEEENCCLEK